MPSCLSQMLPQNLPPSKCAFLSFFHVVDASPAPKCAHQLALMSMFMSVAMTCPAPLHIATVTLIVARDLDYILLQDLCLCSIVV